MYKYIFVKNVKNLIAKQFISIIIFQLLQERKEIKQLIVSDAIKHFFLIRTSY